MQIKRLEINNFLGIGDAILTFDKSGLTLVDGINKDSSSASSNGAGKSSIAEALYWVLYGKTRRGLSGDDVINEHAGKNCRVWLEFDNYSVSRFRKYPDNGGTGLRIYQHTDTDIVELTKGTVKETQVLLESIIGMSELTFNKMAYFGQADIKAFASLGDAELKQVFEQALGLSFFGEYLDKVKKYKSTVEGDIMKGANEIDKLKREQVFIEEKIDLLKKQTMELVKNRKGELTRLSEQQKTLETELVSKTSELASLKEDDYTGALATLAKDREELKRLLTLEAELSNKYEEESKALVKARYQHESSLTNIKAKISELKNVEDKIGAPCSECKKTITKDDVEAVSRELKSKIVGIQVEADSFAKEVNSINESVEKLKALSKRLKVKIDSLADVEVKAARIEEKQKGALRAEKEKRSDLETLRERQKTIKKAIDEIQAWLDEPRLCETAAEEKKLAAIAEKLCQLVDMLKGLNEELEGAKMLVEIMGNGGLKSYIFDSVTPELNRIINEYMNILNSDISVEISTVSKTKAGDFKEKFGIAIDNKNGATSYEGSSGGERQLINLAIALGFNHICRALSSGSVNTLFLDEPFEALDDSNAERAIELCQEFVKKIPNVFLVTHNPSVRDLVANKIQIVKAGGVARMAA